MNEDRLVLPIGPGLRWSDEMPVMVRPAVSEPKRVEGPASKPKSKPASKRGPLTSAAIKLRFEPVEVPKPAGREGTRTEKKPREKKPKAKNDPRLVTAARELRDRWLEHVNGGGTMLISQGKYEVSRMVLAALKDAQRLPALPAVLSAPAA